MRDERFATVLMAASMLFVAACGGAAPDAVEEEPRETPAERPTAYASEPGAAPTICGWVPMPNGPDEYVACPSQEMSAPISDPADNDEYGAPRGTFDPRPEPPGDPPPM